jgi:hypothetical protein
LPAESLWEELLPLPAQSPQQTQPPPDQPKSPCNLVDESAANIGIAPESPSDPLKDLLVQMQRHLSIDPDLPICGTVCKHGLTAQEKRDFVAFVRQGKGKVDDVRMRCRRYQLRVSLRLRKSPPKGPDHPLGRLRFPGIFNTALDRRPRRDLWIQLTRDSYLR